MADNIKSHIGAVPDRRNVAGSVPRSLYLERFGHRGHFAAGVNPPACETCTRMIVDEAVFDQHVPLMRVVEQFAHSERRRAVRTNLPEVVDVFRRERVFEEEQPELLHVFRELYCQARRHTFMHVMQAVRCRGQALCGRLQTTPACASHTALARRSHRAARSVLPTAGRATGPAP